MLSIIVAMDNNNLIGNNNRLPWHLPADLAYFKKITTSKTIIMGRKTFDSIGKALPNRNNIIISSNKNLIIKNCEVINSLEQALHKYSNTQELIVIGGSSIYKQALPFAQKLYITKIDAIFNGDSYFPQFNQKIWQIISNKPHKIDKGNKFAYNFMVLTKEKKYL